MYVCIYIHITHLYHSSINRHLGCFHILATINNAAVNIRVHISFPINVLFFLDNYPEVELLKLRYFFLMKYFEEIWYCFPYWL